MASSHAENPRSRRLVTCLLVAIAVMIPLFTSGSYLFKSLSQEKESRVIELLLASLQPRQLLGGKLLGLGALAMVQYLIWAVMGLLAATLFGGGAVQLLSAIQLSAGEVALVLPYALGGYALYASVMAGLGALSPDMEGSRGWVFLLTLPMMLPVYLWSAIASSPNGPLATALSLIPFSAPVAMLMRMTSTTVPAWQIGVSLGLLAVTTIVVIWLMARLFRVQTLSGIGFDIELLVRFGIEGLIQLEDLGPDKWQLNRQAQCFCGVNTGAVVRLGARPVFCDIDPETFCMDASKASQAAWASPRAFRTSAISSIISGPSSPSASLMTRKSPRAYRRSPSSRRRLARSLLAQ